MKRSRYAWIGVVFATSLLTLAALPAAYVIADEADAFSPPVVLAAEETFDTTSFDNIGDPCLCDCACSCEPWVVSREPFWCGGPLSYIDDYVQAYNKRSWIPITGGAWHWWHVDFFGRDSGYGIPSIPGTYFYYAYVDPFYELPNGQKIGGHLELRLREQGRFRSFMPRTVWPWEAYGYIQDENLGTLKAGLVFKQFGIFWDGVFFGNQPYFDGTKLDADYGLSWEKTTEIDDCFKIVSYVQYFFHEDGSNGSFGGADPESVVGYNEENTGVARVVPTWTRGDGSVVALGFSGLVGQVESNRFDLTDETVSAYGVDLSYTRGPWHWFVEGQQTFGVLNPVRYVSGGPSNRITNFLGGVHYTHGSVTYRCSYSNSLDANPDATVNMLLAGMTITVSKNVDFYVEYVNQQLDGNIDPAADGHFFHSLELILNWHF